MIKIFYKDKIIFLSKEALNDFSGKKIYYKNDYKNTLTKILLEEINESINIYGTEEKEIFDNLSMSFHNIKAAGGIIFNGEEKLLIIKRLGYYDFPKGKVEKGESTEEAAKREISEECGILINDINILPYIQSSFHIYIQNNIPILKETFWYKANFYQKYKLTPQIEEDIHEILFIDKSELKNYINKEKSYPSLVDLTEKI